MKEKMAAQRAGRIAAARSSWKATGAIEAGALTRRSGGSERPKRKPAAAVARMPIRIEPLIRRVSSTAMSTTPARPRMTGGVSGPRPTSTASLLTTSPRFCRPMKVMKSPIPTLAASRRFRGMDSMIRSRTPTQVRTRKSTPERKTTPSAVCQGTPCPRQRLKAK